MTPTHLSVCRCLYKCLYMKESQGGPFLTLQKKKRLTQKKGRIRKVGEKLSAEIRIRHFLTCMSSKKDHEISEIMYNILYGCVHIFFFSWRKGLWLSSVFQRSPQSRDDLETVFWKAEDKPKKLSWKYVDLFTPLEV